MFLAPAFTSGAISLEREKQTLDMLAATPISSLAIVVGKLFSALAYVFLLIAASIPLTAIVFVFGGVGAGRRPARLPRADRDRDRARRARAVHLGPDAADPGRDGRDVLRRPLPVARDDVRGPVLEHDGRRQPRRPRRRPGRRPDPGTAPEALLWFNPFAAEYDVICGASDGYGGWCSRLNTVTNGAISVTGYSGGGVLPTPQAGFGVDNSGGGVIAPVPAVPAAPVKILPDGTVVAIDNPGAQVPFATADPQPFGVRRDTFWPRSLRAWAILSLVLVVASIQLVSPTRRWRWLRRPALGAPLMRLRVLRASLAAAAPVDPAIVPADPRGVIAGPLDPDLVAIRSHLIGASAPALDPPDRPSRAGPWRRWSSSRRSGCCWRPGSSRSRRCHRS